MIEELREEYLASDNDNDRRQFIIRHPELTEDDLCDIMQCGPRYVRRIKKRLGVQCITIVEVGREILFNKKEFYCDTKPNKVSLIDEDDIPDELTDEWIIEKYKQGYSIRTLARSLNKSTETIHRFLMRRRIRTRSIKESTRVEHPCNNKKWLVEHHTNRQLTVTQCAELAGVDSRTLRKWLQNYGIQINTISELIYNASLLDKKNSP